ncbi:alpha/beta hydrolase [Persicobacter sp. CCB-QB2]|uniref:alpha/beta hydrolase n=1 Tax=Persicobacter sp. CCB-QB2 TaxID=1561025 RepID=UPI0006A9A0E4|nr:alpha/beta fold hydrolase [Persicobacter sp. CCB-QB2]
MMKILKVLGALLLLFLFTSIGFGLYLYHSNPRIKAIVDNDESVLYYFPTKELADLSDFDYQEVELIEQDSLSLYHYFFKQKTDSLIGNIFFVHGAGGNASRYASKIEPLLQAGFNVYIPDWRGYGKSMGKPNYKNVLSDSQHAFEDFLLKTKEDSVKTIMMGLSLGGQVAIKLALDNQEQVDALVTDGSIPSAQQLAIDYAPVDFLKKQAIAHPENFNQEYVAVRDIAKIQNLPKLIIHSKKDREVKAEHGKTLFANARAPKTFWETDTEHIQTLVALPEETVNKIKALIAD